MPIVQSPQNPSRRRALRTMVAASLLPLIGYCPSSAEATTVTLRASAHRDACTSPINVIIPKSYEPPSTERDMRLVRTKLTKATLDFLQTHYAGRNVPLWGKKFEQIDFEKRISNISYWILHGVQQHKKIYPVDPAWIMGQMMAESFFYEFAVSRAFAVGVCQFIAPTARGYGMLCAGDKDAHAKPPYKATDKAGQLKRYYDIRGEWKKARAKRNAIGGGRSTLMHKALVASSKGKVLPEASQYLQQNKKVSALDTQVKDARDKYREYIKANLEGRDIFNDADYAFLSGFDQRVTYNKPIPAMVQMIAEHLRQRNGNIIAAAAGYNAGLRRTQSKDRIYSPYGKLPNFSETVTYVSRIFINHHEISRRMTE
ncbi:transglycosylase SLT domain-containing protein [Desulfobaculum bizertense]|nr:transglycosylase SLT domain-containing protein [Desulfobaculum bizertense]